VEKMLQKLNDLFGSGEEGTVVEEHLTEEPRHRPKGIPILVLIASLVDPRMKGGMDVPPPGKEQLWA